MRPGLQQRLLTEARTDWFSVLTDLNRRGLTTTAIAVEIRTPKATVLGWKQGAEPCHADGERLIALWVRMLDRPREQLPATHCPEWLDR